MKKTFFTLLTMVALITTVSAQSMKVYQNGQLKAIYYVSKDDRVEFSDDFPFPDEETPDSSHEYVDLGLPSGLKWATCNVGANTPEEYGDYFAWGETEPKTAYNWNTYKWCRGSLDTMTKYCTLSSEGTVDNKTTLDSEDDAAHVKWGGAWRMPTRAEQDELRNKCTWKWTSQNGVKGYKATGPNGNSIFLPAAGYNEGGIRYMGSDGSYWSSSLNPSSNNGAFSLWFDSGSYEWDEDRRCVGFSIRPVCE